MSGYAQGRRDLESGLVVPLSASDCASWRGPRARPRARPKVSRISSMYRCTLSSRETSALSARLLPGSVLATRVALSSSMSTMATDAPSADSRSATAAPIPLPPPVTRATLPSSLRRDTFLLPITGRLRGQEYLKASRPSPVDDAPDSPAHWPIFGRMRRAGLATWTISGTAPWHETGFPPFGGG